MAELVVVRAWQTSIRRTMLYIAMRLRTSGYRRVGGKPMEWPDVSGSRNRPSEGHR